MAPSFPGGEERWQISPNGGRFPLWNPQGDELFFISGNDLMSTVFTSQPSVQIGTPERLFDGASVGTRLFQAHLGRRLYAVGPDGDRFVVVRGVGMGASEVMVSEGWLRGEESRRSAGPRGG